MEEDHTLVEEDHIEILEEEEDHKLVEKVHTEVLVLVEEDHTEVHVVEENDKRVSVVARPLLGVEVGKIWVVEVEDHREVPVEEDHKLVEEVHTEVQEVEENDRRVSVGARALLGVEVGAH